MLLKSIKEGFLLKPVFELRKALEKDPDDIIATQKLTLDEMKPYLGLKGSFGLFGSDNWWINIHLRNMPLLFICGFIRSVYEAGQDRQGVNNTIDVIDEDGSLKSVGIYINDESDRDLFIPGRFVSVVYALDELKLQPASDGSTNYSKIAIEMA